jgi:ATP-dependent RNA helicase DeaD
MTTVPSAPEQSSTDELFQTEMTFDQRRLSPELLKAVQACGYVHPTKVQASVVPIALAGTDVLAQSRTGSGKTAAFGLPILDRLDGKTPFASLILAPTRELAIQVSHEMRNLSRFTNLKVVAVYGGQRMRLQIPKLQKNPHVIVGTPGRVMDFHRRGLLPYDQIQIAVLDEVDRMLDIGFRDDIRRILGTIRRKHQTIFVSATISPEIERLARQYMNNPEKLFGTSAKLTVDEVEQHYFDVERWDKNRLLVHLLKHEEPAMTLVFCRTKATVEGLTKYLQRKGIDAHSIHGDMYQSRRNKVMEKLRSGELRVLGASDLAARGLDVDDISHVVNYDLPEDPEVYVHRIGRTARAGRKGIGWSFVTPEQGSLLTTIEKLTNAEITPAEYDDFEPGPVPHEIVEQRVRDKSREDSQRLDNSRVPTAPPVDEEKDPSKFPDGLVPVAVPAKRLGGRLRTRRR